MANGLLADVFANLVNNSIKHSEGSVTINVGISRTTENDGKEFYKVIVEDNGPGIPDVQKDKIFNRFLRGDTKARGSGIGLYLVKTLLDSYAGKVWVEDRVEGDRSAGQPFRASCCRPSNDDKDQKGSKSHYRKYETPRPSLLIQELMKSQRMIGDTSYLRVRDYDLGALREIS